uniref:Uncharacterized protein n=1 Tax=Lotharella oceanica TaxID=641309 RepID=A0A7S2TU96_9EUKA|mmetsp:Transcript_28532/g.53484  ORF Transcript_28532/g.53484 Transcript_28532/m.53484 type:complete len:193 (+) Transcript_28532:91-669(+)
MNDRKIDDTMSKNPLLELSKALITCTKELQNVVDRAPLTSVGLKLITNDYNGWLQALRGQLKRDVTRFELQTKKCTCWDCIDRLYVTYFGTSSSYNRIFLKEINRLYARCKRRADGEMVSTLALKRILAVTILLAMVVADPVQCCPNAHTIGRRTYAKGTRTSLRRVVEACKEKVAFKKSSRMAWFVGCFSH